MWNLVVLTRQHRNISTSEDQTDMELLADCMLGKLARWLRILGFDTVYDNFAVDDDLLAEAGGHGRILLTRDRPLADRADNLANVTCVYLNADALEDQLAQLVVEIGLDLERQTFTRCLECNVAIVEVGIDSIRSSVPPHVLKSQLQFFRCPSCERVYWAGSHTERMNARLTAIRLAEARRNVNV